MKDCQKCGDRFIWRCVKCISKHYKNPIRDELGALLDKIALKKDELYYFWLKNPGIIGLDDKISMDADIKSYYSQADKLIKYANIRRGSQNKKVKRSIARV